MKRVVSFLKGGIYLKKKIKISLALIIFLNLFFVFETNILLAKQSLIESEYQKLSQQFYNNEVESKQIKDDLANLLAEAKKLNKADKSTYWQGQIYFLKAEIDEDNRVDYLEESKSLLEDSISKDDQFSDSYRALADTYMRLLDNKGRIFAIRNGPKVIDLLEEATALDDKNKAAYNAKGKAYLEAPRIAGGSAEKALSFLTKAVELNQNEKQLDRFFNYYYLTEVYLELEEYEKALNYIKKALEIFPNNQDSINLKDEILQRGGLNE